MCGVIVRGRRVLASIGGSLPLEVPIGGTALHEIAPRSAHRADNDFTVLDGDNRGRMILGCCLHCYVGNLDGVINVVE